MVASPDTGCAFPFLPSFCTLNAITTMILLIDIGNTHTHLGLANPKRVLDQANIPTAHWFGGAAAKRMKRFVGRAVLDGAALCSVVPRATPLARRAAKRLWSISALELTPRTVRGVGIRYPKPGTIGPDRLANAVAVKHYYGVPSVAVDFGTALTFDVVGTRGDYVGGIIAPVLAAMTEYLHEKTAMLPKIEIREVRSSVGKSTEQAMLIGAVHGYRGLVRELIGDLKRELKTRRLPVVATGGYASFIAANLPEITAVHPSLTLEGLRLVWQLNHAEGVE